MQTLKHYAQILLLTLPALFASCNDDNDESPGPDVTEFSAMTIGAAGNDETFVNVDASGNVYVAGYFNGTIKLGTTELVSAGGVDMYVAKYTTSGELVWAKRAGGTNTDYVIDAYTDAAGNTYITGQLFGTASFDNITLETPGTEHSDAFIVKYNNNGTVAWAKHGGGDETGGGAAGISVYADAAGNVYMGGSLYSEVFFDNLSVTGYYNDPFVAKYNSSGVIQWLQKGYATSNEETSAVVADASGNVYITGFFFNNVKFGTTTLYTNGDRDVFVAKYNSSGALQWAGNIGSGTSDFSTTLATDGSNIYVGGGFSGIMTFGSENNIMSNGSADDGYVIKFNTSGNFVWAKVYGGTGNDYVSAITVEGSDIFVAGNYVSPSVTDGTKTVSGNGGSLDVFVGKITSDGASSWLKATGGTGAEYSNSIGADPSDNVYIAGSFTGEAKLGEKKISSKGERDGFLYKIKPE